MKWLFTTLLSLLTAADTSTAQTNQLQWLSFPNAQLEVKGLPWFKETAPELWRFPETVKKEIPAGVWNRAVAPDGGRILFSSDTSRLGIKVQLKQQSSKPCFIDAYTNGIYAGSAKLTKKEETELVLFENQDRRLREITLYLPNNHEVSLRSIAVDSNANVRPSNSLTPGSPIVFYGSSVLQGTGAKHPSKTYPAILARERNVDFVNLGFGGAGKAEPEVVELINQLEASCFIFDLGKSYGIQTIEPYLRMLQTIRAKHKTTPIICITPIYSTKEADDPLYLQKSENLRTLMRQAVEHQQKAGDKRVHVVEGLSLFGEKDKHLFSDPLHPNDDGNALIASRLAPILGKVLRNAADEAKSP